MKQQKLPSGYEFVQWDEQSVKRFWDFVSHAQPDSYFAKNAGGPLVKHFSKQIIEAENIVDFGCGPGNFLKYLSKSTGKFAGYDLSDNSIKLVQEHFKGHPNFIGAFTQEAQEELSEFFDLAFMLEVVEHLEDDALHAALSDVRSLLKTGGRLIVTTPNEEDLSKNWICSPESGRIFHRWQHVRSWSAASLAKTLQAAGFEIENTQTCNILALGNKPMSYAYKIGYKLLKPDHQNLFAIARKV